VSAFAAKPGISTAMLFALVPPSYLAASTAILAAAKAHWAEPLFAVGRAQSYSALLILGLLFSGLLAPLLFLTYRRGGVSLVRAWPWALLLSLPLAMICDCRSRIAPHGIE